jgi:hypothetical protein
MVPGYRKIELLNENKKPQPISRLGFLYFKAWRCPTLRNTSMYFALRANAKALFKNAPGIFSHMMLGSTNRTT